MLRGAKPRMPDSCFREEGNDADRYPAKTPPTHFHHTRFISFLIAPRQVRAL
jgi:hypothetical protein